MSFYHNTDNALAYAKMCEGYDATAQLPLLHKHLPAGSSVLEIGSGPGNDIALLEEYYTVTASDYSPAFLDMISARFPDIDCKAADAITLDIDGPFDAIYSNKVLQHLKDHELAHSFERQAQLLGENGLLCHMIWTELEYPDAPQGLHYIARSEAEFKQLLAPHFEVIDTLPYEEFSPEDSLLVIARKK